MPTVFLSYSREDLLIVEQLEAHLKNHSEISIWRDQKEIHDGGRGGLFGTRVGDACK